MKHELFSPFLGLFCGTSLGIKSVTFVQSTLRAQPFILASVIFRAHQDWHGTEETRS